MHSIETKIKFTKSRMTLAWVSWGLAALFYLYQFILRVSPGVMTQDLMRDFGVQGCALGVLGAFYYNAYAIMQIPLGVLLDSLGPKRLIASSCLLAALGTYMFSASDTLIIASLGRALMGAGAACGFIGTLKLATLWFPPEKMGTVIGLTMVLGTLGATSAGAPLGFLIDHFGWRLTMFGIAVLGGGLAACIIVLMKEPSDAHVEKLADNSSKEEPDQDFGILDGLMILIRSRQAWLIALFGCLMYVPLAALADLWGSLYLSERFSISAKHAAAITSFIYIGVAVGAPTAMWLSDKLGRRKPVMLLSASCYVITFIVLLYWKSMPMQAMYVFMFLAGVFFCGQNLVFAMATERMPTKISGIAAAFTNMIVMLSGVVFEPLIGWILDLRWQGVYTASGAPQFTTHDFTVALSVIPVALVMAILTVFLLKETYPGYESSSS